MGSLSEAVRRRIAAVILVAGVAVAALAIADIGPFADPPTQQERARSAVEQFFVAAHDRAFGSACRQLTTEERRAIQQRAGGVASREGLHGCAAILKEFLGDQLARTRLTKVVDVRVSGNQAVIDASIRTPGSTAAHSASFHLFQISDEWRINDFGV